MENNENLGSQEPVTNSNPVKKGNAKLIGIIAIVAIIAVVVFFMFFTRSAKATVKDYVKAMEDCNAKKVMALMDTEGAGAMTSIAKFSYSDDGVSYEFGKFEENYDKVMEKMKNLNDDEKKQYDEMLKKAEETMQKELDEMKEEKIKYTVKNIETEKVKDCKKLTKVTCDIEMKNDEHEHTMEDVVFYTMKKGMKNYIVYSAMD